MRVSPASFLMALILDDVLQEHNARIYFRHVGHPAAKQMQTQLKFLVGISRFPIVILRFVEIVKLVKIDKLSMDSVFFDSGLKSKESVNQFLTCLCRVNPTMCGVNSFNLSMHSRFNNACTVKSIRLISLCSTLKLP